MIARQITHCPCCEADLRTANTVSATASAACLLRHAAEAVAVFTEAFAALSVEVTRVMQEQLLGDGKRERVLARRLIRAAGSRVQCVSFSPVPAGKA